MTTKEEYEARLATIPPEVRKVALAYPMFRFDADGVPIADQLRCYRSKQNPRFHYTIASYDYSKAPGVPVMVTLVHGSDSTLPGVGTFGQDPAQLVPCDCGDWRPPTPEQVQLMRESIELNERAQAAAVPRAWRKKPDGKR